AMLLVPGYATGIFHGMPLGPVGSLLFTIAVAAAFFFRRRPMSQAAARAALVATLAIGALHLTLWAAAPRPGWLAAQYRSEQFEGAPEGSTEFSIPGATRIDRAIRFAGDFLPVYFLNEGSFNRGIRREVAFPDSIRWTGYAEPERP